LPFAALRKKELFLKRCQLIWLEICPFCKKNKMKEAWNKFLNITLVSY